MRRISILVIVLLVSLSASAAVQIGVNGVMNPPAISIEPNDTASISIWTDSALSMTGLYGFLGVPQGQMGRLDSEPGYVNPSINLEPWPEPPIPGFSSWIVFTYDGFTPVPGGSTLMDGITFHCDGFGAVDLMLYQTTDFTDWVLNDSQMIYQIPEPATIALLGLGAMLLKRRR